MTRHIHGSWIFIHKSQKEWA